MKSSTLFSRFAVLSTLALSSLSANAALYDRGNGMIYDSAQNITWLQDANYAQTSGYDADGFMTWQQSTDWADNLVFGGYSDWRLSSAKLIGDSNYSYDGSTDSGYNNSRSEIGHLFVELGNISYCTTSGVCGEPGYGFNNASFTDAATGQSVSFLYQPYYNYYWEAETYSAEPDNAWFFYAAEGLQRPDYKGNDRYAWAVRDGDVAAVPVPAAAWLMGSGLLGLAGIARRKKSA